MGIERGGENGLRKKFVNIFAGTFEMKAEALDKNNPNIIERVTTTGTKLIVDQFPALTGFITGLKYIPDSKVGKRLHLEVTSDMLYVIDIPYIGPKGWVSEYSRTLLARLDNVDLDQEVKLMPYSFIPKDKDRKTSGMVIFQGGEKVTASIDYEDIPKAEKIEGIDPGSVTFNPMAQTKWYHTLMLKMVDKINDYMLGKPSPKPKDEEYLTGGLAGSGTHVDTSNIPVMDLPDSIEEEYDDDLPF